MRKLKRLKLFTGVMTGSAVWSMGLLLMWAFTKMDVIAVAFWAYVCGLMAFMAFMAWCEAKEEERRKARRNRRREHRTGGKVEYEDEEFWYETDFSTGKTELRRIS